MKKYQIDNDLIISLNKSLPIASGIGGGSADAAATLRKLSEIFNISKKSFNKKFYLDISKKCQFKSNFVHSYIYNLNQSSPGLK